MNIHTSSGRALDPGHGPGALARRTDASPARPARRSERSIVVLLVMIAIGSGPTAAQDVPVPLTLDQAVERALEHHRPLAAVRAEGVGAEAGLRGALAERWPTLATTVGGVYSNDPVAVFGTRLRQGRFREADFAVASLNDPDALADWTAGIQAEWLAVDPTRGPQIDRSRALARAADAQATRQAEAVVYQTRVLFASATLSAARIEAFRSEMDAARATRDLIRRRVEEGMLMDADLLRAEAALLQAETALTRAVDARADALDRLGLHLALGPDSIPTPIDVDPGTAPARATPIAVETTVERRADVVASGLTVEASRQEVEAARQARFPTLRTTAALTGHAAGDFDDRGMNGTVGVNLSLPLFTAGRIRSGVERSRAAARAAELRHQETLARARVELREAERAVRSAGEAAEAATAAATAADEARRRIRLRLAEGLATPSDALQADAEAARASSHRIDALMNLEISRAALLFAEGGLPSLDGGTDR